MSTVLHVGTSSGILMLKQANGSWEVVSEENPRGGLKPWAIPEICVVPSDPSRVFAATIGDGVWLSEDAGRSWSKPNYGKPGPGKVRCLAFDQRTGALYAGCEPIDVFVSHDLGKNWERLQSIWEIPSVPSITYPVATVEPHARDITLDPRDPETFYVALQVGYAIKTTDGGRSWKVLDKDGVDCDIHTIVIDPMRPERVTVATGGHDNRMGKSRGKALYASDNGGESWNPMAMELSRDYSVPLVMHPKRSEVLYSALADGAPLYWQRPEGADSAVIRTQDGGVHWETLQHGLEQMSTKFPEVIAIDPENPERVFTGYRSGELFASQDAGDSWSRVDVTLPSITAIEFGQS